MIFPISTTKMVSVTPDCNIFVGTLDGNVGIALTESHFKQLREANDQISTFLESDSIPNSVFFFEGSETRRVQLSTYQNRRVVDVREIILGTGTNYGKQYLTKNGFTITQYPWKTMMAKYDEVIAYHNEVKRVFKDIKRDVLDNITQYVNKQCNGCKIDHPSQKQHDCLMVDWNTRLDTYFLDAMDKISYSEITHKLDTFLSEDIRDTIMSFIACNAKKMLYKTEDF